MANQNSNDPAREAKEDPSQEHRPPAGEGEDEFQITVKKLDFVVKPRGVLAE